MCKRSLIDPDFVLDVKWPQGSQPATRKVNLVNWPDVVTDDVSVLETKTISLPEGEQINVGSLTPSGLRRFLADLTRQMAAGSAPRPAWCYEGHWEALLRLFDTVSADRKSGEIQLREDDLKRDEELG